MVANMEMSPLVVKFSGKALDAHAEIARLFAAMRARPCMVVHGGGVETDELLGRLGFKTERLNGLRITPREQIPYIAASLSGNCGRMLQAAAVKSGLKALSLLCSDYDFLRVKRLAPEYGEVGTCRANSCRGILDLFAHQFTPLLCSMGISADGALLNINADDVAAAAAAALDAPLMFLSDVPGVLDGNKELIPHLTPASAEELKASGVISGGMSVKVDQAFAAARQCRRQVIIASVYDPAAAEFIMHGTPCGTVIEA